MYTIKDTKYIETVVSNSRFISYIFKVNNKVEVNNILNDLKLEHKNANHFCFAYIINNEEKKSDDKEPSGTAGMAILSILKKRNLTNIICIVVRYFGGIKLGSGGLFRAYMNSTIKVLSLCDLIEYNNLKITIEFDYDKLNIINSLIENSPIIFKEYNNRIKYIFSISETNYELIKDKLSLEVYSILKNDN